ncbi:MAG: FAD-dependent oxidoreductase [Pseudomonadota bacterium]|nr:FAD-dependent oxidoreductase [Pseudomonadota bacterium]
MADTEYGSVRIGIVGAGPGGLSLARLLTERGLAEVTVLERSDRVGGKSLTVDVDGLGHELGTCYRTAGFVTVKRWMREARVDGHRIKTHAFRKKDGRVVPFRDFVLGGVRLDAGAAQVLAYVRSWRHFHAWDLRGGPDDGVDLDGRPMLTELARPYGEWLAVRGFDVLGRFALRAMTIMGYGALDAVPAIYGLRWISPALLWSGLTHQVTEPIPGWQQLWTHLAGRLDVRRSCTITGVTRVGGVFCVETSQGELLFDHLVITSPVDEAASWFPFDAEQRAALGLDGALSWREYVSTLVEVDGWFRDSDTLGYEAPAADGTAIPGSRLLVARRTPDKSNGAGRRRALYVAYQYGNPALSNAELTDILRRDLAADGGTLRAVVAQKRWKYAPQLSSAAIRGGGVSRFERIQGKGGLWFTGAVASHESVDNIVTYNERLVERMAEALAGRDPSEPRLIEALAHRHRWSPVQTLLS